MHKALHFLIICIFSLCLRVEAQVKLNELTKSNMSFKKSFKTDAYDRNDKEYRDADKTFNTSNYYDNQKSYYDKDKRFNTESYYDAGKRAGGYSDMYNSPELRSLDGKSRFYDENKEVFIDNKNRNLTRDYSGRSDFSKTKNMEDMTNRVYDDLMDRSMSDINKFHSQTARRDSSEGGIPVSPTGAVEEDASILDLLDFSKKKIDNSSVKFTLPRSMSHMRAMPLDDAPARPTDNTMPYPQASSQKPSPKDPSIPDYSKGYKAPQQNNQDSSSSKKTYTIDKPVSDDDAETSIFGVPKQYNTGKLQISVEVKQK